MLQELRSKFSKVIGYMVNMQKLIIFLYAGKSNWKTKLKYKSHGASPLLRTLWWHLASLRIQLPVCYEALLLCNVLSPQHPACLWSHSSSGSLFHAQGLCICSPLCLHALPRIPPSSLTLSVVCSSVTPRFGFKALTTTLACWKSVCLLPLFPLGTREQRCCVLWLFMAESAVPSVMPGTEWLSMRSCLMDNGEQAVVPIGTTHRNVSTWRGTLLRVLLSFLNIYVILLWKKILNEKWCLAMSWSRTGHICRAPVVCMTRHHLQSVFLDTATLDLHGAQR